MLVPWNHEPTVLPVTSLIAALNDALRLSPVLVIRYCKQKSPVVSQVELLFPFQQDTSLPSNEGIKLNIVRWRKWLSCWFRWRVSPLWTMTWRWRYMQTKEQWTLLVCQKTWYHCTSWCLRDIMGCVHLGSCHWENFQELAFAYQDWGHRRQEAVTPFNVCGPRRVWTLQR